MIKNFLCIIIIIFLSIETKNIEKENEIQSTLCVVSIVEVDRPIEEEYSEVKDLLLRVPKGQRASFVKVLKSFADERDFDWRFCLLLMWGESGISTTAKTNSFMGLIMFGYHARLFLKVSESELLQKNFIEQAEYAVMLWKKLKE